MLPSLAGTTRRISRTPPIPVTPRPGMAQGQLSPGPLETLVRRARGSSEGVPAGSTTVSTVPPPLHLGVAVQSYVAVVGPATLDAGFVLAQPTAIELLLT